MEKRSIKIKWFVAILSIIVLLSGTSFFSSVALMDAMDKETIQDNERHAILMKNTMDDSWERVFKFSWQIYNSELAKQMEKDDHSSILPYQFASKYSNFLIANPMIEDFYLYFPQTDMIIESKGVHSKHASWVLNSKNGMSIDEREWENSLFGNPDSSYFTVQCGDHLDLYYRIYKAHSGERILIAKINVEELEKTLSRMYEDNPNGMLALTDNHGVIYAYAGNYDRYVDEQTNTVQYQKAAGGLLTIQTSDITTLNYVTITEKSDAYHLSMNNRRISLFALFFSAILAVVLSVLFVRKGAQPVENIAKKFSNDLLSSENELDFIDHQIDILLEEKKQGVEQLIRQQNLIIRGSFLGEALKLGNSIQHDTEHIATAYGLGFENDCFAIVVRERSGEDYSDKILNYLCTNDSDLATICWTQKQDLDVFLLNYDEKQNTQNNYLEGFLLEMRELSSDSSRIVCSNEVDYLEKIKSCYIECLQKLNRSELSLVPGNGSSSSRIKDSEADSLMSIFQNYLFDEKYKEAIGMLPQLCELVFEHCDDEIQFSIKKYKILAWLTLKSRPISQHYVRAFIDEQDAAHVQQCLLDILNELEEIRGTDTKSNIDSIATKSRSFIYEHYENPMLGLAMLSDQIGFSQSYISHAFKEKYGVGLLQYMNQVRIERAKKLLKSEAMSIKEIALCVGFSGDAQFIRVFKKLEQVTPNAFRVKEKNA